MTLLIWEVRTSKKISLERLADLTGISKSALDNYENGKTYPTIKKLEDIAIALDTHIQNLYESEYK